MRVNCSSHAQCCKTAVLPLESGIVMCVLFTWNFIHISASTARLFRGEIA